jgi:hypothetical protein
MTTTIETTTELDLKGYTIPQVQRLIDQAILDRENQAWRREYERKQEERQAKRRAENGKRISLIATLKRHGISVTTQSDSYYSKRDVNLGHEPEADGSYRITVNNWSNDRMTAEAQERYTQRYNQTLASLINSDTLTLQTHTEEVRNFWDNTKAPETRIYYTITKK